MGPAPFTMGKFKNLFWDSAGRDHQPIKIENFFGIFKVLGKEESTPVDLDEIRDKVTKASQYENQTKILKEYLDQIRSSVDITVEEAVFDSYEPVEKF
jgi:parvulin-like peptidyl-prolyl isomerase